MLKLAQATRRAYFQAVAAAESVRYMEQVSESAEAEAEAGAELAARMANRGNFPGVARLLDRVR